MSSHQPRSLINENGDENPTSSQTKSTAPNIRQKGTLSHLYPISITKSNAATTVLTESRFGGPTMYQKGKWSTYHPITFQRNNNGEYYVDINDREAEDISTFEAAVTPKPSGGKRVMHISIPIQLLTLHLGYYRSS